MEFFCKKQKETKEIYEGKERRGARGSVGVEAFY
jgi:hypothetical protein